MALSARPAARGRRRALATLAATAAAAALARLGFVEGRGDAVHRPAYCVRPLSSLSGESHGTQHWSLDEWKAALGPLLESHKRKTDPLLSAVAARNVRRHLLFPAALAHSLASVISAGPRLPTALLTQEAARAGDKPTAGEAAVAKATAEAAAKIEARVWTSPHRSFIGRSKANAAATHNCTLLDASPPCTQADKEEAAKQAAAKEKAAKDAVDEKAAKTAAAAKEPAKEVKPAVSRLEALKREVVGATAAGATTAAATAGGAAKQAAATGAPHEKSLVEKIEEGIEAAEAAVAGVAQVLSGGAAGGAKGGGEVAALAGGGDASLSPEQQKKVQEMKARLGLVAVQQAHHRHRRRLD